MEFEIDPLDGNETFDFFDVELHTLKKNMRQEVVKVFKHFVEFLKAFDFCQVHNMLALMLEPCFKSLRVVESFVGHGNVIRITIEYDVKEVIFFLMTLFG